jgi:hypothetical protein
MRLCCALLAGIACLSTGCSALMARSGEDLGKLSTREQVHQVFGEPLFLDTVDGTPFEEFLTRRKISEMDLAGRLSMGLAMTYGLLEFVEFPTELYRNGERIVLGQSLCFHYDQSGVVKAVYLNGEKLHTRHEPTSSDALTPNPSP